VLAFSRHPIYGLMTYIAEFYLDPSSRWWGPELPDLRWSMLAAGVTLLALLVAKKDNQAIPLFRHKVMLGLILFLVWIGLQTLWALDVALHLELITLAAKYTLLVGLIYKCVDSEKHLRFFLWTHVIGCSYLGYLAFTSYIGGRMEGFGGGGIDEANTGALQIVTGIFVASSLFLTSSVKGRAALFGGMPFMLNALVTTISRSGFLAMASGGVIYNLFAPRRLRWGVRLLSVLAVVLFTILTNPMYWTRMSSIAHAGEDVEGVDTGAGRLVLIGAQWRMFKEHPLGCGHRCTAVLSPQFLDDRMLTGVGADRARSSHNTVTTLLVEQGVPGVVLYVMLLIWTWNGLRTLGRQYAGETGFLPTLVPAVASILGAIIVGDMFVDYLKFEARLWFMAVLMVLINFAASEAKTAAHRRAHSDAASSRKQQRVSPCST
jgi:O-antigen ligase